MLLAMAARTRRSPVHALRALQVATLLVASACSAPPPPFAQLSGIIFDTRLADLSGLATGPILEQARSLQGWPSEGLPQALLERLSTQEAGLVREITAQPVPPVLVAADCVVELRRLQLAVERADVQRQMARLLEQGISSSDQRINELGMRQLALKQQIDSIGSVQIEPARSDR